MPGTASRSASAALLFGAVDGRNPAKKKRSVGSPESVSAATAADGPGAETSRRPPSATARARSNPGSEIIGVPASEA